MLSGKLWPVHLHPYPDELLSSWLVRLAHANGMKVQTFTHQVFGIQHQVWNRDIDRLAPEWLMTVLAEKTATPIERVRQTTLKRYEGVLFDHYIPAGVERWITPLRIYHRTHKSHGMQFCPECLKEDNEPYFRIQWRVALYTFCPKHQILMHDSCPECGEPVAFHRLEIGQEEMGIEQPLSTCFNCRLDLVDSILKKAIFWNNEMQDGWVQILVGIEKNSITKYQAEQLVVLHQFVKLLSSGVTSEKLLSFIESKLNETLKRPNLNLRYFESKDVFVRFQITQCAWWLLLNWPLNLYQAWLDGSIRYNRLLKDLEKSPDWYIEKVENLRLNYKTRQKLYHSLNK